MSVRNIVTTEAPVLRQVSRRVPRVDESIVRLLDDLAETLAAAHGAGLAAPQIGVPLRAAAVKGDQGQPVLIVNPEIVKADGSQVGYEGCLSIPGMIGEVERAETVVVKGLNRKGKPIRVKANGFTARAYQHEIDHLNGVLFTDKLTNLDTLRHVDEEPEGEAEPEPAGANPAAPA
ncbi:MAG: peptide deformylase, partial [Candidatus Dormiibacterota bacterium]